MAEFFDRIVATNGLNNFVTLYIPSKDTNTPELLTTSVFTVDLKQLDERHTLASIPAVSEKIVANITNTLRRGKDGTLTIDALDNFQNMYTKGTLVAAYNDMPNWLNSYSAEYCIKTYSMILSNLISRYYNLGLMETFKVRTILALFMAQMLNDGYEIKDPPYFNRATWGDLTLKEITDIATEATEGMTTQFDLDSVAKALATCVSEKMDKFDTAALVAIAGNLGPDVLTSRLAIEYPPYWVYILLQSLSGVKSMLTYQLNQQRLVNDGRTKFLANVLREGAIFEVKRY